MYIPWIQLVYQCAFVWEVCPMRLEESSVAMDRVYVFLCGLNGVLSKDQWIVT